MKQFISPPNSKGSYLIESQEIAIGMRSIRLSAPIRRQPKGVGQSVTEQLLLPGLKLVTDSMIYHTTTKTFVVQGGVLVQAGYGISVHYKDCKENAKSKTKEGIVTFFSLPAGFSDRNFTVLFPNPAEITSCGDEAEVKFAALLCAETDD